VNRVLSTVKKKTRDQLPAFLTGAVDIFEDEDFRGCEIFELQYSRAFEWFDPGILKTLSGRSLYPVCVL
jgi:hypothetical protein